MAQHRAAQIVLIVIIAIIIVILVIARIIIAIIIIIVVSSKDRVSNWCFTWKTHVQGVADFILDGLVAF